MAERRLGTLRHIVFILKTCMLNVANWFVSCSGIFAARTPARRALRLRECYGLPTVNRYHGTLTPPRIAPSRPFKRRNGSIIVPNFSIMASSRTTRLFNLSVDRSLRLEVLAAEDKLLREKRKDPQHWIFCYQGTVKPVLIDPFTLQRTFFPQNLAPLRKKFLLFFGLRQRACRHGRWKGQKKQHIPAGFLHTGCKRERLLFLSPSVAP